MTATIWTYWDGPKPPIIELCEETIIRNNPTARFVGPNDIRAMGGGDLLEFCAEVPKPQQSDLIRMWLIHEFGGIWLDSDTVCTNRLDMVDIVDDYNLVGIYNPNRERPMLATPFGAKKGSPIIREGIEECKTLLLKMKQGEHIEYGQTSAGLLSRLFLKWEHAGVKRFQHWRYSPIFWKDADDYLSKPKIKPPFHQQTWHLTNRVVHALAGKNKSHILKARTLLGSLLR